MKSSKVSALSTEINTATAFRCAWISTSANPRTDRTQKIWATASFKDVLELIHSKKDEILQLQLIPDQEEIKMDQAAFEDTRGHPELFKHQKEGLF